MLSKLGTFCKVKTVRMQTGLTNARGAPDMRFDTRKREPDCTLQKHEAS